MCLTTQIDEHKKLKRRLLWWPRIKIWKRLRTYGNDAALRQGDPIQFHSIMYPHLWTIGENISDRDPSMPASKTGLITHGFHAYTSEEAAIKDNQHTSMYKLVVPLIGWKGDLIATGKDLAVFRKLTFRKQDYNKAIKVMNARLEPREE